MSKKYSSGKNMNTPVKKEAEPAPTFEQAFEQEQQVIQSSDVAELDTAALVQPTPEPVAEPTPAPTEAPTPAPTQAPVEPIKADPLAAVLREKTDFEKKLDELTANSDGAFNNIVSILKNYVEVMGVTNTVMSQPIVNQHQGALWRIFRTIFESEENFVGGMNIILAFFTEYRTGAFSDRLVFRGFEHTRLNPEQSKSFQSVLSILTTAAGLNDRKQVTKVIDLARAMEGNVFTESARQRVIGYFH